MLNFKKTVNILAKVVFFFYFDVEYSNKHLLTVELFN